MTNIAKAYLEKGDWDNSIKYCERAMMICEDETEYEIMAQCKFYQEKYAEALEWYKKIIVFLETTGFYHNFEDNGVKVLSLQLDPAKCIVDAYENMAYCYIQMGKFEEAIACCKLAQKYNPYNDKIRKLEITIRTVKSLGNAAKEASEKVELIKKELSDMKEKYNILSKTVKEWAAELLKIRGEEF